MLKIAVVGANGKSGRLIVTEALRRGYDVTAVVRHANESGAGSVIEKDVMALTKEDLKPFDVVVDALGFWTAETIPLHITTAEHLCDLLSCTEKRLYIVGGADLISVTYSFVTGASTGGAYAPAYIVCGLIFFVVCFPLSTLAARWEASLKERKGRVNPGLKTAAKKVELKEAA